MAVVKLEAFNKKPPQIRRPVRATRVALIGNYPPRRCGIATFTADLREALIGAAPALSCDVYAMSDGGAYDFPAEVKFQISQHEREAYVEAARRINASGADIVCLQHEFGIFGGAAGEHVLALLDLVRAPVVVTLHTVLEQPSDAQRRVLTRIARRAAKLIVMAEKGREILCRVYRMAPEQIAVVPHGAPDAPLAETSAYKAALGFAGRELILTFGLLSPGKGIEHMIRAMPRVVAASHEALYVVLGATHPNLIAREGEAHRESLAALAAKLGVDANVRFVNTYVDQDLLLNYLSAADIYVTPYLNPAQITSGTLAYAFALGKPIVSTPYWHAQELLAGERGLLAPFSDPSALADACINLLTRPALRESIRARAYAAGRDMTWPRVGQHYVSILNDTLRAPRKYETAQAQIPEPSLHTTARFTSTIGIFQHSSQASPDPRHGYCLDDNARALILTLRLQERGMRSRLLSRLENTYAAFVDQAWSRELQTFRNFMDSGGAWLEQSGSHDSFGRAFWSLGAAARHARKTARRRWACALAQSALNGAERIPSPRALAFVILGLTDLDATGAPLARPALHATSQRLLRSLLEGRRKGWRWFESYLSYDNAKLPEALLRAGAALGDVDMIEAGLGALGWLCTIQTAPCGWFRPVGSESLGKPPEETLAFDQQPLEAAATIEACEAAFKVTRDAAWVDEARRAFDWYLGENDLGVSLVVPEKGLCYDALTPNGPSLNHGAESILSFQLASVRMQELSEAASRRSGAIARGAGPWAPAADTVI